MGGEKSASPRIRGKIHRSKSPDDALLLCPYKNRMSNTAKPAENLPDSLTAGLTRLVRQKPVGPRDLDMAALFVLDAVANILGGRNSEPGRTLLAWWNEALSGNSGADAGRWAFLMGALCHILETDDLHRTSVVHPGCVVVPAAWARATRPGAEVDGSAFLTAVLHGFEAATRVGMAVGAAHYKIWHNTATCGPFGSAMAGAHLLGLSEAQTVHALGNAGSQSSGLWQFLETGAMTKHLHAGHAAEAGLRAAELAKVGFTGPPKILEGEKGFFRAACPDAKPEAVLADAEAPWQLTLTSIKPWPSCRHTHPAIDAAGGLRARLKAAGAAAEDIVKVEADVYQAAIDVCDRPSPDTDYDAKFSLQHAVAVALLRDKVDFEAFGLEERNHARALAARVELRAAQPYDGAYPISWGSAVRVHLKSGEVLEETRKSAKGDPEAPLARDEMIEKAAMLMRHGGVAEPDRLIEDILALAQPGSALPVLDIV